MGNPSKVSSNHGAMLSSSPLNWDGKCHKCRKLMSRCICFQELESDADPLHTGASNVISDASETRPLWNVLRKMHRNLAAVDSLFMQETDSDTTKLHRERSEALVSPTVPSFSTSSTSTVRPNLHQRLETQTLNSESRRELSPERETLSRKDRLQRVGITISDDPKRDVKSIGVMRSVQSTNSIGKHNSMNVGDYQEQKKYESVRALIPSDEDDGTVWEL